MSRVDQNLEEWLPQFSIGGFRNFPRLANIGERHEFDATQEFNVPAFDTASNGFRFAYRSNMQLYVLSHRRIKVGTG